MGRCVVEPSRVDDVEGWRNFLRQLLRPALLVRLARIGLHPAHPRGDSHGLAAIRRRVKRRGRVTCVAASAVMMELVLMVPPPAPEPLAP
jgi:hypothetical protein